MVQLGKHAFARHPENAGDDALEERAVVLEARGKKRPEKRNRFMGKAHDCAGLARCQVDCGGDSAQLVCESL